MAVNLLNPQIVVIGGGVAQAGDCLFGPLREEISRLAVPEASRRLRVVPGQLGAKSALYGAAALACAGETPR
jgi:glucokinase